MKSNKQFSTAISNKEHWIRADEAYNKKVLPFLVENRKAYKKYQKSKLILQLTPAQCLGF